MRIFVINLARAEARRCYMLQQFTELGLEVEFHEAVDGRHLTKKQYAQVDRNARKRMGLKPQADGSIANWLSQRRVMQEVAENGTEVFAIFEDDAELSPDLPSVLAALEQLPLAFDIVKLSRRTPEKEFVSSMRLSTGHRVGRVRYHDFGTEGYVITRGAARRFLASTPKMTWELDQAINYYWETGLNIFHLDPPVVAHDDRGDSQIAEDRVLSPLQHREKANSAYVLWRRGINCVQREWSRRQEFQRRIREDRMGVGRR